MAGFGVSVILYAEKTETELVREFGVSEALIRY